MNQRGFTLLEVLIATTISTLVLGSALWLLGGGLDAERRAVERQHSFEDLVVLARRLERELPSSFSSELGGLFQGDAKKLHFSYTTASGLAQVEWESREDGIYAKRQSRRAPDSESAIKISSWRGTFSYLDQGGGWQDSWQTDGLPKAVRVELEGKGKHRLTIPLEAGRVIPSSRS